MLDTDKTFCSILFDVMALHGVREAVCSPGSRNAPLLIAAAARPELKKHVVVDERSAAFLALGLAMSSGKPVALVCTSGTALLNYAPAVAEAFYQGVPLVVVSADRPRQWIDQDDSQTLRQFEALGNFVKKSYDLPSWGNGDSEMEWYANRIANDAMIEATGGRKGPVHVNIALGEPLGRKTDRHGAAERKITRLQADTFGNKGILEDLAREAASARILFVAGFMQPSADMNRSALAFTGLPNVAAMTETLSNLHLSPGSCAVDSVLTAYGVETLDAMAPDLVVSVGGALVSRKLKEYLRRNSGKCRHWSVGWQHTTSDCFQSLTERIEADPARFLRNMAALMKKHVADSPGVVSYAREWRELKLRAAEAKKRYVESVGWCDLTAIKTVLEALPRQANLFLSNGTCVRYAQILATPLPHATWGNRGVSGIDGCTSTAIGCAINYSGPTVLLTGDMSMAYDIGALGLTHLPENLKIAVVDNTGGGIFRFIPSTSGLEEREDYFCAPPRLPLRQLAEGYGLHYAECDGRGNPDVTVREFLKRPGCGVMRLATPPGYSAEVLRGYMEIKK